MDDCVDVAGDGDIAERELGRGPARGAEGEELAGSVGLRGPEAAREHDCGAGRGSYRLVPLGERVRVVLAATAQEGQQEDEGEALRGAIHGHDEG